MVSIKIEYKGDLRCEAVHEPSGTRLITDAPVDNHGKGESFSPTDLVATGLGTCIATIMGIVANEHGIDLSGMTVSVCKEMESEPVRRIRRLPVTVRIPRALAANDRTRLERAAAHCPVHKSIGKHVDAPIAFAYGSER